VLKFAFPLGVKFINILRVPFTPIFLRQYFCAKILQSQSVARENLRKALLYKKFVCKMLMKLTLGFFKHNSLTVKAG